MATIFGDVQYTQVMGHLPTPVSPAESLDLPTSSRWCANGPPRYENPNWSGIHPKKISQFSRVESEYDFLSALANGFLGILSIYNILYIYILYIYIIYIYSIPPDTI